jgi:hypothetical protein
MSIPSWQLVVLMLAGSPVQQHKDATEKLGRDAFFNKPNYQEEMRNFIETAEHLMATLSKGSLVSQSV